MLFVDFMENYWAPVRLFVVKQIAFDCVPIQFQSGVQTDC